VSATAQAWDVMVLGAGPAGVSAAIAAARHGLRVALLDEQQDAGGQVYRATPREFALAEESRTPDHRLGDALRAELAQSAVAHLFGRRVWLAEPGFTLKAVGPDGLETHNAPRLIVATGTTERVVPVPGWTLPGVIGLAAATVALKAQKLLPGRRTVVAGVGPLVPAVAVAIVEGGGSVALALDLAGPADWLKALPQLASRPDLLRRGVAWLADLRRAGVSVRHRRTVVAIEGGDEVAAVRVAAVDAAWRPTGAVETVACDSVTLGHGLVPATEVTRLLGARHVYRAEAGGWIAAVDDDLRTSIAGLYVAGDAAGIAGAAAAVERGRLAGLAAASDAGSAARDGLAAARRTAARAERFGRAMARLMASRPGLLECVPTDAIVCRCEDVTRGEIEEALDAGAREVNQLKSWTRCGMGPCQGRMCGDAVADLVARRAGSREAAGIFSARPPLRPVPYAALTGTFAYEDLKLPAPAPS
jgi:thioredoxin reductase